MLVKYLLEGLGIAIGAKYLMGGGASLREILLITVTVTATFMILDMFAPAVGSYSRQGAGFRVGLMHIGGGEKDEENKTPQELLDEITQKEHFVANFPPEMLTHPAQHESQQEHLSAQHYESESVTPQINYFERFMDDPVAVDYYKSDQQPHSCGKTVHEKFENNLSQRGGTYRQVEPFQAEMEESLPAPALTEHQVETNAGQDQTVGDRGLVYGTVMTGSTGTAGTKSASGTISPKNPVYSGDLIQITDQTGGVLTLPQNSKFLTVSPPEKVATNNKLFKLRFQSVADHKNDRLVPLKYGEPVALLYNDEGAQTVKINHQGDLNILNTSQNSSFEIIKKDNQGSQDIVTYDDHIYLRCSTEGQRDNFLKINKDRIETTASQGDATVFLVKPQKGCGPLWRFSQF